MTQAALGALAATWLLVWASAAAADERPNFELDWESPSICPQQAEVDSQLRLLLGVPPESVLPSRLRAKGVVEPIGERFQLTLSIQVAQTQRSRVIASDECRSLGKAAAVVLGLLIRKERDLGRELTHTDLSDDFGAAGKQNESSLTGSKTPQPLHTDPAPPVVAQTPDEQPKRQWHLLVRGPSTTLDLWTLPNKSVGFGLAVGLVYRQWRVFASTTLWLSQERTTTSRETYQAGFKRNSAELSGCRGWRSGTFEIAPCLTTAVDLVSARASSARLAASEQRAAIVSVGARRH